MCKKITFWLQFSSKQMSWTETENMAIKEDRRKREE